MLFSRFAAAALPLTAAYAFSASLAACSRESAQNNDSGAPPDASTRPLPDALPICRLADRVSRPQPWASC